MKIYKIIYQNISKQKLFLCTNILLCSICSLLGMIIPIIPGYLIDNLICKEEIFYIITLLLMYIVLAILSTILDYIKNIAIIKNENKIYKKTLSDIMSYLTEVEVKILKRYRPAYLTQRIDNDISNILKYIIGYGSTFIITSLSLIISIYILFHINIAFAIIALISIPIYILMSCVLKKSHL